MSCHAHETLTPTALQLFKVQEFLLPDFQYCLKDFTTYLTNAQEFSGAFTFDKKRYKMKKKISFIANF